MALTLVDLGPGPNVAGHDSSYAAWVKANAAIAALNALALSIRVAAVTTNATPIVLAGSPAITNTPGAMRLTGHVQAQNTVTGEVIVWDVAAAVAQRAAGTLSWVPGDSNPSIAVFAADTPLAGCVLALAFSNSTVQLVGTGLAGTSLAWTGSFLLTVT